uniref:UDP-glucuronosyltransferase n=1 Tax=Capitella teleta TaxID=283909 RepID=X1YV34_CAPTE
MLKNEDIMQTLEEVGFDAAIVDGISLTKYLFLIPHRLNIPIVTLSDGLEPWHARVSWLPSFCPLNVLPLTDNMNFFERLQNFFFYIYLHRTGIAPPLPTDVFDAYSLYGAFNSPDDIIRKTQLWIMTSDPVLDYPKPYMPNMVASGGLATKPAKPLDQQWGAIVEKAESIVLVSFGSMSSSFPKDISLRFLSTFSMLPHTVIWRFQNEDNLLIPDNVIITNWLPQNDLMAQPKVRVFITHCGNNGQFEALYHGVPMIGMPLHGDQYYNAQRIPHKGFGRVVEFTKFAPEELVAAVEEVINNQTYRENIHRASLMFHDRTEGPAERAVAAIEQFLRHGSVQSHAVNMPLYQFLMLDVLGFCALVIVVFLVFLVWIVRFCLCKKQVKHKTQ